MKKLIFVVIILITTTACSVTRKIYSYQTPITLINDQWVNYYSNSYISISPHITDPGDEFSNVYEIDFEAKRVKINGKTVRPKIIFKDDIQIIDKEKVYIIKKEEIETFRLKNGKLYISSIDLKKLGIEINNNFIITIGEVSIAGKDRYISPVSCEKYLNVYKYNPVLDNLNQPTGEYLYSGFLDTYKGD